MKTETTTTTPKHPLVNEHPIHLRIEQQTGWLVMSILLGAGFIAGLYWLGFQQDYHYLIPALPKGTSLKAWWDGGMGFIHSGNWAIYRHGIRDNGEPAVWTMVGATLLGKAKTSSKPLPFAALFVAPFVLLAMLVAGALAISWVINFGFLSHVSDKFSWQSILLGFILGRILHIFWAPFGNTIRYHVVAASLRKGTTPLWVTLPLMPPAWREYWSEMKSEGAIMTEKKNSGRLSSGATAARHPARVLVPFMVLVFVLVAIVGLLAKYGVAHGLHVPVMNP
jgi:hypothetical protein